MMDTVPISARHAHGEIAQALAALAEAKTSSNSKARYRAAPRPSFKPLVLQAIPTANVRRVGSGYECFVGDERISANACSGFHPTPNAAWQCLARFIAAGGAT